MTIGFLLVIGVVTVVVVNASAVFLRHRELMNSADAASLRAADAVDELDYFSHQDPDRLRLDAVEARAQAARGIGSDTDLTAWVEGTRVYVRLEQRYRLPIRPPGMRGDAVIVAEADAQVLALAR